MTRILSLTNVAVRYRQVFGKRDYWALEDVSMTIDSGETVGVIGRNGAGKSTLLKVLSGIIDPDKGSVERAPVRAYLLSLSVGFLPQLSGIENAILGGIFLGLTKSEITNRLEKILDFAELGEFAKQPIFTYSSGMKARLGFSVAYHSAPQVLLIDEVLGVGDLDFRQKSSLAIQELINSDRTVILVSHQLSMLQKLCSRIVWIEDGRTKRIGKPEEIIAEYKDYVEKRKRVESA